MNCDVLVKSRRKLISVIPTKVGIHPAFGGTGFRRGDDFLQDHQLKKSLSYYQEGKGIF